MSRFPDASVLVQTRTSPRTYVIRAEHLLEQGICVPGNEAVTAELFGAWIALVADSPLNNTQGRKPTSVFTRFYKSLHSRPAKSTILEFSALAHEMVSNTHLFGAGSSTGPFLQAMIKTPIFREYHHWWTTEDPSSLRYVLTFLFFGKKHHYDDPEFGATALRSWEGVEERISTVKLPGKTMKDLSKVMAFLLPRTRPDLPFMGASGPGYTAEGVKALSEKVPYIGLDAKLSRASRSNLGDGWRRFELLAAYSKATHEIKSESRLKFVPKDLKTYRSICMEPASYMFVQQHYRRVLEHCMKTGFLRNHVRLEDQSINQDAARIGSTYGTIDTIDLSAASDSVLVALVRNIFPQPWVRHALLSTRTSMVKKPDGKTVTVRKFAPMGSALCFPVQCFVYAAVCIYATILYSSGKDGDDVDEILASMSSFKSFWKRHVYSENTVDYPIRLLPFNLYGDDLCVDYRLTPLIIQLLQSLGFVVNTDKSFRSSQAFRESCGKFYWAGHDVTPVMFRVRNTTRTQDASHAASAIDFINRAGDEGLAFVHRFMINRLIKPKYLGGRDLKIAFSSNRQLSSCIYSKSVRNDHLRKRAAGILEPWNLGLHRRSGTNLKWQRAEVRGRVVTSEEIAIDIDWRIDLYRYILWWTAAVARGGNREDCITIPSTDSSVPRLRWAWLPME